MADVSNFDSLDTALNARLTELQNDKTALEALVSPNQSIMDTLEIIDNQIAFVQNRITSNQAEKQSAIDQYDALQTRNTDLMTTYDSNICDLVNKYN